LHGLGQCYIPDVQGTCTLTSQPRDAPQFYLTSPTTCPYLPGRQERKVFTHLVGRRAPDLNNILSQGGFRRSQTIAYRPACETCRACVSVRVAVDDFKPSANMKRVLRANADLIGTTTDPKPTSEQFSLFRSYLDSRHSEGGMADMTALDYAMMVEDSHVDTRVVEYRHRGLDSSIHGKGVGDLLGVCLIDRLGDGLSMVYSFYEPEQDARSLGTYMILDHIERARALGLPYLYLGYWVEGSPKMEYKGRFKPQERLMPQGWVRFEAD
jgi:leucyl-tRNA---protein transferase